MRTAVARKNLDQAYAIVGPDLRGRTSPGRSSQKGNIPIVPYPRGRPDRMCSTPSTYSYPDRRRLSRSGSNPAPGNPGITPADVLHRLQEDRRPLGRQLLVAALSPARPGRAVAARAHSRSARPTTKRHSETLPRQLEPVVGELDAGRRPQLARPVGQQEPARMRLARRRAIASSAERCPRGSPSRSPRSSVASQMKRSASRASSTRCSLGALSPE